MLLLPLLDHSRDTRFGLGPESDSEGEKLGIPLGRPWVLDKGSQMEHTSTDPHNHDYQTLLQKHKNILNDKKKPIINQRIKD